MGRVLFGKLRLKRWMIDLERVKSVVISIRDRWYRWSGVV